MSVEKARNQYYYDAGQSTQDHRWTGVYSHFDNNHFTPVLVGHYATSYIASEVRDVLNTLRPFEHAFLESARKTLRI